MRAAMVFAVLGAIGAIAYWWSVYWVPARDLRRMGIDEVRWWNLQQSDGRAWMDGSSQTYVYRVSKEAEERMMKRCLKILNEFPIQKAPPCYLYQTPARVSPEVSVTVGKGVVVLDYVWF